MSKKYKPEIFRSPFGHLEYTLVRDSKDCKQIGLSKTQTKDILCIPNNADATANFVYSNDDEDLNIVVYLPRGNLEPIFQQSLIMHEAVHIWQQIRIMMAEKEPSLEFEAYSIQRIAEDLLYLLELSNVEKRPD